MYIDKYYEFKTIIYKENRFVLFSPPVVGKTYNGQLLRILGKVY